ncbi:hypothetical protein E4U41_001229 [Claviceps citrina]|nr:hypothetical protein E4U41_001229 [Claviceps citrina]
MAMLASIDRRDVTTEIFQVEERRGALAGIGIPSHSAHLARSAGTWKSEVPVKSPSNFTTLENHQIEALNLDHTVVKTFSNLLNSTHHPFAGARCSAASGGASDSIQTQ